MTDSAITNLSIKGDKGDQGDAGIIADCAAETVVANATAATATPVGLAVAEQSLVGRITAGHVVGLTVAQIRTLLGVALASDAGAKVLTSNFTTSSTSAVSTNLAFAIAASEVWDVDVFGTCSKATSAEGLKFAINCPASCTIQGFQEGGGATLAALPVPSLISAINTLGTALATGIAIRVIFRLHFRVVNSSTAGNITLQVATVTANTAMVYAGTKMNYQKASQV